MRGLDVELRDVSKRYGDVMAVDHLCLGVASGSFLTLLGPSGCGKTTTLRIIGGFERPSSGEVFLMQKRMTNEPPYRRATNMVFQDYALFPHKTVAENIGFGLKMRRMKKPEIEKRVREMLDLINLPDIFHRASGQLSGGQQQRVALARALILRPPVLLLDEPLGALDAKIRKQLQLELKQLQRELGITFIYVTHDQEEAMTMSDIIAVMNHGHLEQLGSPQEIYERPKTRFVAKFIGECNLMEGTIVAVHEGQVTLKDTGSRIFRLRIGMVGSTALKEGKAACLAIRPEDIVVGAAADGCINRLRGMLREKIYTGSMVRLVIDVDDALVTVDAKKDATFSPPSDVPIGWNPDAGSIILEE
jgi:spermidine/putrescine transport system ATP-binding protein